MPRFQIDIREHAWRALNELAIADRRSTKDQAAVLLERVIHEETQKRRLDVPEPEPEPPEAP